jgi:ribonuclease HIII
MSGYTVRKLSHAEGERVREKLAATGDYEFRTAPYAYWAAKGPGVSVTHYEKGKFLVQGKGADDFAASFLDDPDELIARAAAAPAEVRVDEPIIGTDESGKGDYFGPLVTAGMLVLPGDVPILETLGVRDSKDVRDPEARKIAAQLREAYADRIEIISIGPARYNELHSKFGGNLNLLLAWAHGKVVKNLLERHECGHVLADKFANERVLAAEFAKQEIDVKLQQRVRAESHPAVAAASILARSRFLGDLERLGRTAGVKLRKGAGAPVDAVARELFREGGIERLRPVAKLHFKTTEKARS